jgi:hypothetical protein
MVTETQCDEMHGSWLGGLAPTCNPNPCPASAPASGPSSPPAAPQSDRQTFYLVLDSRYVGTGGPWTLSYQVWQAGDAPEEGLAAASGPTVEVAPNPFASLTRITYGVAGSFSGSVRAEIFDPAGRLIRSLPAARGASGSISWDGRNERGDRAAAGVYFLRLHAGATAITRPLILID